LNLLSCLEMHTLPLAHGPVSCQGPHFYSLALAPLHVFSLGGHNMPSAVRYPLQSLGKVNMDHKGLCPLQTSDLLKSVGIFCVLHLWLCHPHSAALYPIRAMLPASCEQELTWMNLVHIPVYCPDSQRASGTGVRCSYSWKVQNWDLSSVLALADAWRNWSLRSCAVR
jgi:hypothetical protein